MYRVNVFSCSSSSSNTLFMYLFNNLGKGNFYVRKNLRSNA